MTPDDELKAALDEVLALSEKANIGPWSVIHSSWDHSGIDGIGAYVADVPINGDVEESSQDVYEQIKEANAELIVAAVNFLRTHREALLRAVEDAEKWRQNVAEDAEVLREHNKMIDDDAAAREVMARASERKPG